MVKLLLGLRSAPSPHDAADALAVAICHLHSMKPLGIRDEGAALRTPNSERQTAAKAPRSWRHYRPPAEG
jgi:hypothetical protein